MNATPKGTGEPSDHDRIVRGETEMQAMKSLVDGVAQNHDRIVQLESQFQGAKALSEQRARMVADQLEHAAASIDQRLAQMNEFRAALSDQTASFISKAEFQHALDDWGRRHDALRAEWVRGHSELSDRVTTMSQTLAASTGAGNSRQSMYVIVAVGISFIVMIAGLVDLLTRK